MIPVCEPTLTGKEKEYVADCLDTNWISSNGKYIKQFEEKFSNYCGVNHGVSCSNGTVALHLAMKALNIGYGDEVIVPSFTMISCAKSVVYTGATPVFVDAEKDSWNIDVNKIEEKITKRTKAIMPVHIYGHPCDMDKIMKIAEKYNLYIIEDCAEAHGAEYKGKKVGSFGHINCFSFYANKIITTGEGGMVVTNDEKINEKLRSLKNLAFGTGAQRYIHKEVGFNYRMTNIQAAIGLAQLENIDSFIKGRRKNAQEYNAAFKTVKGLVLPVEKEEVKNVYWMYGVLVNQEFGMEKEQVMEDLLAKGIETRSFFHPMHLQPIFKNDLRYYRSVEGKFPVSEELGRTGFYLPSSSHLSDEQRKEVINKFIALRK